MFRRPWSAALLLCLAVLLASGAASLCGATRLPLADAPSGPGPARRLQQGAAGQPLVVFQDGALNWLDFSYGADVDPRFVDPSLAPGVTVLSASIGGFGSLSLKSKQPVAASLYRSLAFSLAAEAPTTLTVQLQTQSIPGQAYCASQPVTLRVPGGRVWTAFSLPLSSLALASPPCAAAAPAGGPGAVPWDQISLNNPGSARVAVLVASIVLLP